MGRTSSKNVKKDLGWNYHYLKDPQKGNTITCIICDKTIKGGVS